MRIARLAPVALLATVAVACGKDKKASDDFGTNLSTTQRTELQQKLNIAFDNASPAVGLSSFAGFGLFVGVGRVSTVNVTTDLSAAARRVIVEGLNAALATAPNLQGGTQRSYMAMGVLFHLANQSGSTPVPDLTGVIAWNGFPITSMIFALSESGGTTISTNGSAAASLMTFTGGCTSSSNCTVGQWIATSGTVNVSPSGSSGGSCAGFPNIPGSGLSCNTQRFNAGFDLTQTQAFPPSTGTHTAVMNSQTIAGIKLTVDCNQIQGGCT